MTFYQVEQAALNNALWCDAVCRAHSIPGEFHKDLWLNHHLAPRFYPNAVTLSDKHAAGEQMAHIQGLMDIGLPGGWGVKDSFACLDLNSLGFRLLFEATWLWRQPSVTLPSEDPTEIRWMQVQDAPGLARWEAAWNGAQVVTGSAPAPRLFLPELLADAEIAFFSAWQDESIVAGGIANRTGGVVGLSNFFTPPENGAAFWSGCIRFLQMKFPDLPIVGYESGPELALTRAAGFEPLQNLRVWTCAE